MFCLTVGDVMTPQPLCLAAALSLTAAIDKLNEKAVRRAPVLDASGALIGIITLDDLLPAVAGQLSGLADTLRLQARRESQESAPARQVRPRAQVTPDE
jgi:CBS-domain-containing membrane protein